MPRSSGPVSIGRAVTVFPPVWLRDNCLCADCRDSGTGQRLLGVSDVPAEVRVRAFSESADAIVVTVEPEGHVAECPRSWLNAQRNSDERTEATKRLWKPADLSGALPVREWADYLRDPVPSLADVRDLGFALLTGTPAAEGTVLTIAETFGYVRETNYGRLFDVRVTANPTNLAFTGRPIAPHTDNPYRDPVPTVQLLHCLDNAVEGGESGLLDGFHAAALLRDEDPDAFAT